MVNIYLFIELLGSANAGQAVDALKALQMENSNSPMSSCYRTRSWWPSSIAGHSPMATKPSLTGSPRSMAWYRPISSP